MHSSNDKERKACTKAGFTRSSFLGKFLAASIARAFARRAFFLSEILAERNVCDFCARNLLMYLHDVRSAIFQQYCRRIYRIGFLTIGLNKPVVRFHFISIYQFLMLKYSKCFEQEKAMCFISHTVE